MDNLKLLEYSLKNPEPIIDKFYLKAGSLLISLDPQNPTILMKQNADLLESISAYNFASKEKNKEITKKALQKILQITKGKNINYSEFISFWPIVDISYSLFSKMSEPEQMQIIKEITEKYIELRHGLYKTYGYTPTTLQVGKDAKAHKESGNLGINKVSKILEDNGFKNSDHETVDKFVSTGDKKFIQSDKKGKKLFKKLLLHYKISFSWSSKKEEKMPDLLLKYKNHIYIIEHKHMKESGGGQDKQMNEVISLIGFGEKNKNFHYIAFLDGLYFNLLANKKNLSKGKVYNQINSIKQNLKNNKQNYFVNTAGFKKLLQEFK